MEDKSFLHGLDAAHRLDEVAHEGHAARIIFPDNLRVQTLDGKGIDHVFQYLRNVLGSVCCLDVVNESRVVVAAVYNLLFHGLALLSVGFCKLEGKLAFVLLAAQLGAAVLKPCLYLLHGEKLAAHVPLSFPVAERLRIIAYQAIERVHGLSERLAVGVATDPLLATETEQAAVVHYQSFTISSPLAMRTRSVSTSTLKRVSSHWAKRIAIR